MAAKSSRAELDVVRWLCYAGFFFCLVWLVITLSTRGEFAGPLVGALFFGFQTTVMYMKEQDTELIRQAARDKQQRGGGGTDRWNIDDRGADPTQPPGVNPPTRPQPTIIEGP